MALTRNASISMSPLRTTKQPLADNARVFRGSALGLNSGRVRAIESGDTFVGFAAAMTDSRSLAEGAAPLLVGVISEGQATLSVTGVVATSLGDTVYADDDGTFTLTAGGSAIGTVQQYVADDVAVVLFEAFFSAGGGGGATAFTDLTDAPAVLEEGKLLFSDGNTLSFSTNIYLESFAAENSYSAMDIAAYAPDYADPYGQAKLTATQDGVSGTAKLTVGMSKANGSIGSFQLETALDGSDVVVHFEKYGSANPLFKMTGFDVVASDATATMTVSGQEYSIAKAIKVKIGADTYFWPLFGPQV